ncbi:taurine dioxygenase-like protein [Hyaloraphidium curvatum]|nr:taurine dioxygenase-like protein [Hyaloraphidium curvatum]
MSKFNHIKIKRMGRHLGALVEDIDLKAVLADTSPRAKEVRSEIRRAWLENGVLFFRRQPLTEAEFVSLANVFNPAMRYPFVRPISEDYPQTIAVKKLPHETNAFGNIWHSDTSYLEEPPSATLLIARELPPHGLGDTCFASQTAAYEGLSPKLRHILEQLVAVNSSAKADVTKTREDRVAEENADTSRPAPEKKDYEAHHPAVCTHPETGKRVLYVNVAHTARFDGMTAEESEPLLNFLFRHQVKAEYSLRWTWESPGDIAIWDNRSVQHYPVNDYHGYKRLMHRITTKGERPRL